MSLKLPHQKHSRSTVRWRRRIRPFLLLLGLYLTLGACLGQFDPFSSSSVCRHCGSMRHSTKYYFPFTSTVVWESHSSVSTPVSEVLMGRGLVPRHEHGWLFCSGGGNGVTCAIGSGRHIRSTVNRSEVADLLAFMAAHDLTNELNTVRLAIFDPQMSWSTAGYSILFTAEEFDHADEFLAWHREEWSMLMELHPEFRDRVAGPRGKP